MRRRAIAVAVVLVSLGGFEGGYGSGGFRGGSEGVEFGVHLGNVTEQHLHPVRQTLNLVLLLLDETPLFFTLSAEFARTVHTPSLCLRKRATRRGRPSQEAVQNVPRMSP